MKPLFIQLLVNGGGEDRHARIFFLNGVDAFGRGAPRELGLCAMRDAFIQFSGACHRKYMQPARNFGMSRPRSSLMSCAAPLWPNIERKSEMS